MTALAFIIVVIVAFYAGYKYEHLLTMLKDIKVSLQEKIDRKPPDEEKSTFLDPLDPVLQAKMEHDRIMKSLNPDYDD